MKRAPILIAAATMLAVSAFADEDCHLIFLRNPNLPRDCVEMAWTLGNSTAAIGCLYDQRGIDRPNVSGIVQVAVFTTPPDGILRFLGWSWMVAQEANGLHQSETVSL
jgi:hypothetical protein